MATEKKKNNTEQSLQPRPLWQRLTYPLVGIILIILGIILWLTPVVMGFPLIIAGMPLLLCFHPRLENWGRRKMRIIWQAIRRRNKSK